MRLIILLSLCLAGPSLFAADLPGSRDLEILPRFPRSEITDFRSEPMLERLYPQGSIRRISGQLRYEREVLAEGAFTAVTYRLSSEHSSAEAFEAARRALMEKGAELLYWCQGRDCGSSSLWANSVFGKATLYGPDDQQAYALLRLAEPNPESLLALYAITRGNRRAYLHVEQLDSAAPLGTLLPAPATLLRQLKSTGELKLLRLSGEPEQPWVEVLARSLNLDTTLRVSLDGPNADAWREALVAQGVRAARLELGEGDEKGLHLSVLR